MAHPPRRTIATRTIHNIGWRFEEDAGGVMTGIMAGGEGKLSSDWIDRAGKMDFGVPAHIEFQVGPAFRAFTGAFRLTRFFNRSYDSPSSLPHASPRIPMSSQPTLALARFVVAHGSTDIPPAVMHEARRALLNWVGCAVGASRHETVKRALAALAPFSGPRRPPCSAAASGSTSCTRR